MTVFERDLLVIGAGEFVGDNARFFELPLAGRAEPLGVPGGAGTVGALGVDTDLVAEYGVR